jgi:hypothetical protein
MGTGLVTRDASEADFDGYPANLKPGYRISGAGRMPDIRPDLHVFCLHQRTVRTGNNLHQRYGTGTYR